MFTHLLIIERPLLCGHYLVGGSSSPWRNFFWAKNMDLGSVPLPLCGLYPAIQIKTIVFGKQKYVKSLKCGPTAHKLSKQIPVQDILGSGSRRRVSSVHTSRQHCHFKSNL